MPDRVKLFIVDDHTLFRRGLIALLLQDGRFEVVGEAGDASEALHLLALMQPDLLLLDNHLPGVQGIEAIGAFKKINPALQILMLTVSEDEHDLTRALQAGADGYLLKTADSEQLCDALIRMREGQSVISPPMMSKLITAIRSHTPSLSVSTSNTQALSRLSPREREILGLIARGLSNKQIARDLGIADTTVKLHVQHIFKKLGLGSRVQAAVYAANSGVA